MTLGRFASVNEWRVEFRIFPKVMAFRPIGYRSLEFHEFREELFLVDNGIPESHSRFLGSHQSSLKCGWSLPPLHAVQDELVDLLFLCGLLHGQIPLAHDIEVEHLLPFADPSAVECVLNCLRS